MKKRRFIFMLLLGISLVLSACSKDSQNSQRNKKTIITSTPTLFFHGGGSSSCRRAYGECC